MEKKEEECWTALKKAKKPATLRGIAEAAGISPATVAKYAEIFSARGLLKLVAVGNCKMVMA